MSAYVDDTRAKGRGRMVMCRMVADTSDELHALAQRIGLERRWLRAPGTHREHYYICLSMRRRAVQCGATEVTAAEFDAKRVERANP